MLPRNEMVAFLRVPISSDVAASLHVKVAVFLFLFILCSNRLADAAVFAFVDTRLINTRLGNSPSNNSGRTDTSWLNGGIGALRYDEDSSALQLGQGILGASGALSDYWSIEGYGSIYLDNDHTNKSALGINELFLQYRPLPVNGYRLAAKIGAFFPELSTENTRKGWTSASVLTNSAINTWLGEEIKNIGVELSMERLGRYHSSEWDIKASASVFGFNDPAGSLLAWRGWSMHDRQIRLGETTDFARLPVFQQGRAFDQQSSRFDPHLEIDNRPGYILGTRFSRARGVKFSFSYYNNRGDPSVLNGGQYSWKTNFSHISLSLPLPAKIKLTSQWMKGSTKMGEGPNERVDADYQSWFSSISKRWRLWDATLRYDEFRVEDKDRTPFDNNAQHGHAWTLAFGYRFSPTMKVIVEHLEFKEKNYIRHYFGLNNRQQYHLTQAAFQWRLN